MFCKSFNVFHSCWCKTCDQTVSDCWHMDPCSLSLLGVEELGQWATRSGMWGGVRADAWKWAHCPSAWCHHILSLRSTQLVLLLLVQESKPVCRGSFGKASGHRALFFLLWAQSCEWWGEACRNPHVESKIWAESILRNQVAPSLCGALGDLWHLLLGCAALGQSQYCWCCWWGKQRLMAKVLWFIVCWLKSCNSYMVLSGTEMV